MKTFICQIDAIANLVSRPYGGYDLGELRSVSLSMQNASAQIEAEISRRVQPASKPQAKYWEDVQ